MAGLVVTIVLGLLLAASGGARAQNPDRPFEEFPVFRALERLAVDGSLSLEERLSAIGGLGDARHPSTLPVLLALLRDPTPAIRTRAAEALGWAGNEAAVEPLLHRARDESEEQAVRTAAIDALGRIAVETSASAVEGLSRHPDVRIRRAALLALFDSALGRHTDQVGAAIRMLQDAAQDGHARSRAAALLGGAPGDARVFDALLAALQDPRVPAGYDALPRPETLNGMQRTIAERLRSLHNVRAHAAWALGALGDRRAVPELVGALADPDPAVRLRSAGALGRLGAREAGPALRIAVGDGDPLVRAMAVAALGVVGDRVAGTLLRQALADESAQVRERAAAALGQIGDIDARDDLVRLSVADPVPAVRQAARAALAQLEAKDDHLRPAGPDAVRRPSN